MLEINGIKYSMLVSYLGPGKVGYFFKIQCGDSEPSFEHATAVLPAVEDIYETAREVNAMSTKAVIAVGVLWVHYCLRYWEMKLLALEHCLMRGQQSRV